MRFAKVILPLPLHNNYTYSIPAEFRNSLRPGFRVVVPFGKRKYYTGLVEEITDVKPDFDVKEIYAVPDLKPVIKRPQLQLWQWIADYYLCATGEVYNAAVPTGLKVESETFIELSDVSEESISDLGEREKVIIELLSRETKKITIGEIEKKTGLAAIGPVVGRLLERGVVSIHENLVDKYVPKKETLISPLFSKDSSDLQNAFEAVKGAKRQESALMAIIEMSDIMRGEKNPVTIEAVQERIDVSRQILNQLAKKGLIEIKKKEVNRFTFTGKAEAVLPSLTDAQQETLNAIHQSWKDKDVTLLRGVTSSGKTEIYMHLADFVMRLRRQVLYLVPEIALTTQLTERLQRVFGDKVVIYHSKFTDNERVDIWKRLLDSEEPCIVVGARSSVFLPFGHLGLVIVDEEHDPSYKQQDPAPRYNGRDTAIVLARMHGAKTLLGSATPAVDTYYKAQSGKYGLVELTKRFGEATLPDITVVDMARAKKTGNLNGPLATDTKLQIEKSVESGNQAIIFLNRRGYSPVVECKTCGWTPKCEFCDVSLTYHKSIDRMVCHYCGTQYPLPSPCPKCKEPHLITLGYGTERVEDEIEDVFKGSTVIRMDRDTTRNKDGHQKLIKKFSDGEAQILVGTQMVTKGLDFGKVSVVAILNTDTLLHIPDFRSSERAFNTLEQVAGRSGRRGESKGSVLIQAFSTDHPVLDFIKKHDYLSFYKYEIEERKRFNYPPFTRLVYIYIKHRDREAVEELAVAYTHELHRLFGNRVFGPEEPYVARIQSMYIRKIMLKIETEASMQKVRKILRDLYLYFHSSGHNYIKSTQIYYDVDPV